MQQIHEEAMVVVVTMTTGGPAMGSTVMFVPFVPFVSGCDGGSRGGGKGGGGESAVPTTSCSQATLMPRLANADNAAPGQPGVAVPFSVGGSVTTITTDVFALVVG